VTIIVDHLDIDPALNAGAVARAEGISIVTLNRRIRTGKFPPPDFLHGQYRYWRRSSVLAARAREIQDSADRLERRRQALLAAAANARAARQRKRAERAERAASSPDAV